MAYAFNNQYAKMNGFTVHKSKILRSKKGEILQQIFACHRQGFREDSGLTIEYCKHGCNLRLDLDVKQNFECI